MADINALHTKKFPVFIPEYFVNRIPKYFTEKVQSRLPMVNGIPVSIEEYMEKDPDYVPSDGFIPEPIYDPFENNITFSMKSVVEIYNAYINNVNVQFQNPNNMLDMITVIYNYIEMVQPYILVDDNTKAWSSKLQDFAQVLKETHDAYMQKFYQRCPNKNPNAHRDHISVTELLTLFKRM